MATRTPVTPFYAIAGAGDLAVEKVRAVGEDVTARFAKLDQKTLQAELTKELTKAQGELTKRFEAIVADARTRLASFKLPKQLVIVERVPRAPNGKADYPTARKLFEEASARTRAGTAERSS